jgi:hypothetical protein
MMNDPLTNVQETVTAEEDKAATLQPVPAWIKQGAIGLAAVIAILVVWMIVSGGDNNDSQKILADIETPAELIEAPSQPITIIEPEVQLPIHSEEKLEEALNKSAEINPPPDDKTSQILQQLTETTLENNAGQKRQDALIQDLQSQLTAQALKITQLQSRLTKPKRSAKKGTRTTKRIIAPFTLVSVDQWGNNLYAILRYQGELHELTLGQRLMGWRVDAIDRNKSAVNLKHTSGKRKELLVQS